MLAEKMLASFQRRRQFKKYDFDRKLPSTIVDLKYAMPAGGLRMG
jgi:hypothetical protein